MSGSRRQEVASFVGSANVIHGLVVNGRVQFGQNHVGVPHTLQTASWPTPTSAPTT